MKNPPEKGSKTPDVQEHEIFKTILHAQETFLHQNIATGKLRMDGKADPFFRESLKNRKPFRNCANSGSIPRDAFRRRQNGAQ